MFIKIPSVAYLGLASIGVEVEINTSKRNLPFFEIVGLPAKAIDESKERVRAAIFNSKIDFPKGKIVVNLAPADIPKEGSYYDLPIAVGIIASTLNLVLPPKSIFFGELSLDGSLRHTKGALLLSLFAKENGFEKVFLPSASANEAAIIKDIDIYPIDRLKDLVDFLLGGKKIEKAKYVKKEESPYSEFDMSEVLGQSNAKRAIEIAAAGGHNIFMVGGPGSGKTMLARAIPGILPLLNEAESLEVTKIYSIAGNLPPQSSLIQIRPFRSPHHTISSVGLIGGGSRPKPGEITLAHRGVLFLDEFNEFQRPCLEALRQPMEDGYVLISRSQERAVYPSRYMLVASANPCPCGYLNHPKKPCLCSEREIIKYRKKISGPIMDRIDIHLEIPDVATAELSISNKREEANSSKKIREKIERARQIQDKRFINEKVMINGEASNKHIEKYALLESSAENLLGRAAERLALSARAYFKTIKVARTIADLEDSQKITEKHIAEALQYRPRQTYLKEY